MSKKRNFANLTLAAMLSLSHPPPYPLTHSLAHSYTLNHSLTHTHPRTFSHPLIHSLIY